MSKRRRRHEIVKWNKVLALSKQAMYKCASKDTEEGENYNSYSLEHDSRVYYPCFLIVSVVIFRRYLVVITEL